MENSVVASEMISMLEFIILMAVNVMGTMWIYRFWTYNWLRRLVFAAAVLIVVFRDNIAWVLYLILSAVLEGVFMVFVMGFALILGFVMMAIPIWILIKIIF